LYPDDLFYTNKGYKQDFITFVKFNKSFKDLNLFVDLQYRYVNFNYDKKMSHGWHFFNPKVGLKYSKKDWNIYTSIAMTGREVTRTDLLNGYDNVDVINKTTLTSFEDTFNVNFKPERCYDLEVGGFFTKKGFTFSGNVYVMYFNNERISTGDINYIGLLLKSPTEKSIRTGLEIDMNYKYKGFSVATNLSVSKNKIYKWSDKNGNNYLNVSPFGSPRFTMNNTIEYSHKYFFINLNSMFISKMYLDNTQNNKLTTPSYYLLNSITGVKFKSLCISLTINNIVNTKYYLPGGLYMNMPAFYPGALRNYLINVQVTL
jgi:iron complex outermembrane receptor protein